MGMFTTHRTITAVLFLATFPLGAQECHTLQAASLEQTALYLNSHPDRQQDAPCIRFAIGRLGEQRYEPAIPVLTRFLDFRWPVGAHQKQARIVLDRDKVTIYPASDALEKFGQDALPAVLTAMEARSTSQVGLEVAVSVWMTLHRDNAPLGVSLLKQEANSASDPFSRQQLISATYLAAAGWCDRSEQAQCNAVLQAKPSKQNH